MQFHDLNRYIGLCLVKNGYCAIPALGALRLKKNYAENNAFGELVPINTTVTFEPVNSIDDQFAHFIGLQENISSNNASNMLSKFGKAVKAQVLNGDVYVIDGVGKFVRNGNEVGFDVNSSFDVGEFVMTPPSSDKPVEHEHNKINYTAPEPTSSVRYVNAENSSGRSFNGLGKILLPVGLVALLGIGGYFLYNFVQKQKSKEPVASNEIVKDTTSKSPADTSIPQATGNLPINPPDTSRTPAQDATPKPAGDSTAAAATPVAFKGPALKVAIHTFDNKESADKKCKFHTGNGNNCTVQQADSSKWLVVINLPNTDRPADKVVDSLRRFFNPKGPVFAVK
jgi:hypothetical protein